MLYPLNTNDPKEQILDSEEMFMATKLSNISKPNKPYIGDDIADYHRNTRFARTSAEAFRDADYAGCVWHEKKRSSGNTYGDLIFELFFAILAITIIVTVIFKVFTQLIPTH